MKTHVTLLIGSLGAEIARKKFLLHLYGALVMEEAVKIFLILKMSKYFLTHSDASLK